MRRLRLAFTIIFFSLMIFNYSTEPTPPPYHRFYVSGHIVCDSLTNLKNFTIALYGKSSWSADRYVQAFSDPYGNNGYALTDSTGFYFLIADNHFEFDSVKTAIVQPGKESIFSQPYFIDKTNRTVIYKKISPYENNSGCCSNYSVDVPQDINPLERYEYHLSNVAIKLCD